ncbi:hypothetical protein JTE90_001160 [Oedothorax gibbosus]|uniref:Mesencephalic astrocyte-derived neurotrophic factor homolog n=1 Tax=Oedothorax gibbosus TaxID=931172 RepID=A0AAV6VJZ2_9ARAC|nr:hypothetical protein JTE90_001160 [Oedothorax gibbosus]
MIATTFITILLFKLQGDKINCLESKSKKCEVCVEVLTKFAQSLRRSELNDSERIEERFVKFCRKSTGPENRFCYYIGGTSDSATRVLSEMSKPLSWGLPVDKICQRLGSKDLQVCDLRYKEPADL